MKIDNNISPFVERLMSIQRVAANILDIGHIQTQDNRTGKLRSISILTRRVIDGIPGCAFLLAARQYSYVLVLQRTMIESVGLSKLICENDDILNNAISDSNKKHIRIIEYMCLKNPGFFDLSKSKAMSKKYKHELNDLGEYRNPIKTTDIVNSLDKTLKLLYKLATIHSHNDLNELTELYYDQNGKSLISKEPSVYSEIRELMSFKNTLNIVYSSIIIFSESHGIINDQRTFKFEETIKEMLFECSQDNDE